MPRGTVTIQLRDTVIRGGSVVYVYGSMINPLQTLNLHVSNVTVLQGAIVVVGAFVTRSALIISDSTFASYNFLPQAASLSWLTEEYLAVLTPTDISNINQYASSLIVASLMLDGLSQFIVQDSILTAYGFNASSSVGTTAAPLYFVGEVFVSTSSSLLISGCVLSAWSTMNTAYAAASLLSTATISVSGGSVLGIIGSYVGAPILLQNVTSVDTSSLVILHDLVMVGTHLEGTTTSGNQPRKLAGSGSVIQGLSVTVLTHAFLVVRGVSGTATNVIAASPNGNITIGGSSNNSATLLITSSVALGALVQATSLSVAPGSEVSLIGNQAGAAFLSLQFGWSMVANTTSVYMGCNTIGGVVFGLRDQYSGYPMTNFVCEMGCGTNGRCLNTTGAANVTSCKCKCLGFDSSRKCSQTPEASTTTTLSTSMSLTSSSSMSPTDTVTVSSSPSDETSMSKTFSPAQPSVTLSKTFSAVLSNTTSLSPPPTASESPSVPLLVSGTHVKSVTRKKSVTHSMSSVQSASLSASTSVSNPTKSSSPTSLGSLTPSVSMSITVLSETPAKSSTHSWNTTTSHTFLPSVTKLTMTSTPSDSQMSSTTLSLSQQLSASSSLRLSPTSTLSFSQGLSMSNSTHVSPTVTLALSLLSTSSTPSVTASSSSSSSLTSTRTASRIPSSPSATLDATPSLSPLWPGAIGITVGAANDSLTMRRYLADGVERFGILGPTTFVVWPLLHDGQAVQAGFHRHPQPPFHLSLTNPTAQLPFIASMSERCSTALPCEVVVVPSFDPSTVVEMLVDYGTTAIANISSLAVFAYESQTPVRLEVITDSPRSVCRDTPLPELYLRAVDINGFPYAATTSVLTTLSISKEGESDALLEVQYPVSGQLGPAMSIVALPDPSASSVLLNLVATAPSLQPALATFELLTCPIVRHSETSAHVIAASASSPTAVVLFHAPLSSLPKPLLCILTSRTSSTATTQRVAVRINASTVQCSIDDDAADVTLVIGDDWDNTTSQSVQLLRPLSVPRLQFMNTYTFQPAPPTAEASSSLQPGCVAVSWLDGDDILQEDSLADLTDVTSIAATLSTSIQAAWNATSITIIKPYTTTTTRTRSGWFVCFPSSLEPITTAVTYSATVSLSIAATLTLLNGTVITSSASVALTFQPSDLSCHDMITSVLTPALVYGGVLSSSRTITFTKPITLIAPIVPTIFIDNSTCQLMSSAKNTAIVVSLAACSPPLTPALVAGRPKVSDIMLQDAGGALYSSAFQRSSTPTPRILAVEGCSKDVFPQALGCPPRGRTPLTIHGSQLLPIGAYQLSFTFADNPNSVLCTSLTHVDAELLVCTSYPGFGTNGTAVLSLVSSIADVVAVKDGVLTFGPNAAGLCPNGTNGIQCSGRGTCDPLTGHCACDRSPTSGYWGGADCSACDLRFNQSDGCLLACPISSDGVVCSGRGECANGLCFCGSTWTTNACDGDCPGVGSACSAHGTCDTETGSCTCIRNADGSGFAGVDCAACVEGFSGADCTTPCPVDLATGNVCSGRGACFEGGCMCVKEYCGRTCELTVGVDDCGNCQLSGIFGTKCEEQCPGAETSNPCSGHGRCSGGRFGTGKCLCSEGYGMSDCSAACATSADGSLCGNVGTCSALTGTCVCDRFRGGAACTTECPRSGLANLVCGGHGKCDEGSTGTGACICNAGYRGDACDTTCSDSDIPCNGRGICSAVGLCECNADATVGYWDGDNCDRCAGLYAGPDCIGQCPTANANAACSGHGTCGSDIVCLCESSIDGGHWGGEACNTCQTGYYGPQCLEECPGGACAPCFNHGRCSDGVNGTGVCTCDFNATFGFWSSYDCSLCVAGWYGYLCGSLCPRTDAGVFCGNGTCRDGYSGDGVCVCNAGFTVNDTTRNGVCTICADGYFGANCTACPSNNGLPCSGNGICDDGLQGTGICTCRVGYSGPNCSLMCPVAFGRTCGNGGCVANNTCVCAAYWDLSSGSCSTCIDGNYGLDCSLTCPPCVFGKCMQDGSCVCHSGYWGAQCDHICPGGATAPCSGNGTCNVVTGTCACKSSLRDGFYIGDSCDQCDPRYNSIGCSVPCPVFGGYVCYGRGTCFNGACNSCAPLSNETELIVLRCGTACEGIDSTCVESTGCDLGYYGPTCSNTCPGTTFSPPSSSTVNATCSRNGLCTVDGSCLCKAGYYGTGCSSSCPASPLGLCSNRGVCRNATCTCYAGSFGVACEGECPGGLSTPCNRRGTCDSHSGVCTCRLGYYGTSCAYVCPGGATTPCTLSGTCQLSGSCQCYNDATRGFFIGDSCSRCAEEYAGPSCNITCLRSRGSVVSRRCQCLPGYVGDNCSQSCPVDTAGVFCSSHGSCVITAATPSCSCDTDYYGSDCATHCTVASCQRSGLYRPQCNPSTGSCECRSNSLGQWTGSACDVCVAGYWGSECSFPCACNSHGTCSRDGGLCQCYRDISFGFWMGTDCSVCASGYTGSTCNVVDIDLTVTATDVTTVKESISSAPQKLLSIMDDEQASLIVQDAVDLHIFRVLRTTGLGNTSVDGNFTLPFVATRATVLNATHYSFVSASGEHAFVLRSNPTSVTSSPLEISVRRSAAQAICNDTVVADVMYSQQSCAVMSSGCGTDHYLQCSATALPLTGSAVVITDNVVSAASTPDGSSVVLFGESLAAGATDLNWAVVVWNMADATTTYAEVNGDAASSGKPLACVVLTNEIALCAVYSTGLGLRVSRFAFTNLVDTLSREIVQLSTQLTAPTVTVLVASSNTNIGMIGFHSSILAGSSMYLFQASTLDLLGSLEQQASTLLAAAEISDALRQMIVVLDGLFSTIVRTLNLFGIRSVSPDVVDFNGGATITVSGVAFPSNSTTTPIWCNVSDTLLPAVVLNDTHLECTTISAANSDGTCSVDRLSIVVGGTFQGRSTTRTGVIGLYRPIPAELETAVSVEGDAGYGSYDQETSVTLSGFGFVESVAARCRLEVLSPQPNTSAIAVVYETSVVQFISATRVQCFQPSGLAASATTTAFRYSHDGTFFGASVAPFQIVGPTAALAIDAIGGTIISAETIATLSPLHVYTTDLYGNRRMRFENMNYSIRCSTLEPQVQIVGNPELITFTEPSQLLQPVHRGVALFSGVKISSPTAGTLRLHCFATVDIALTVTVDLTIVAGQPAAIAIDARSTWVAGVLQPLRLQPSPHVWLVDAAGNFVSATSEFARVIYTAADVDSTSSTATAFASPSGDGTYTFESIIVRTTFDVPATMKFSIGNDIRLTYTIPQELCVAGVEYAVSGSFECAPCPPHGICDGTSTVQVQPGYWRADRLALTFYECSSTDAACPGGGSCNEGYEGVRCGACSEGYGRSASTCERCSSTSVNSAVIAIVFAVFLAVIYYLSIYTMPVKCFNEAEVFALERTERNPFSIVMKIAISHFQMISIIPFASLKLPPWLASFVAGSGRLSMQLNISFFSCAITPDDVAAMQVLLAIIPVTIGIFIVVSAVAAILETSLLTSVSKIKAQLYRRAAPRGVATDADQRENVAKIIACDNEHFSTIVKSHDELFNDDEQLKGSPTVVTWSSEKNLDFIFDNSEGSQERFERFINMLTVSVVVILFIMYPTIVDACAGILQCQTIDYGSGKPSASVVERDPSIDCASERYRVANAMGWGFLIAVGIGVPVLSVAAVRLISRVTCRGDIEVAKTVFFFTTGGYRDSLWFWECVSLARKFVLVIAVTAAQEDEMRILFATWVIIFAFLLNISLRPWAEFVLSVTEATSLGVVALTFGLCGLLFQPTIATDDANVAAVYAAIAVVNLIAVGVIFVALLWSARRVVASLAQNPGLIGRLCATLIRLQEEEQVTSKPRALATDVISHHTLLKATHERLLTLADAERLAHALVHEGRLRLHAEQLSTSQTGSPHLGRSAMSPHSPNRSQSWFDGTHSAKDNGAASPVLTTTSPVNVSSISVSLRRSSLRRLMLGHEDSQHASLSEKAPSTEAIPARRRGGVAAVADEAMGGIPSQAMGGIPSPLGHSASITFANPLQRKSQRQSTTTVSTAIGNLVSDVLLKSRRDQLLGTSHHESSAMQGVVTETSAVEEIRADSELIVLNPLTSHSDTDNNEQLNPLSPPNSTKQLSSSLREQSQSRPASRRDQWMGEGGSMSMSKRSQQQQRLDRVLSPVGPSAHAEEEEDGPTSPSTRERDQPFLVRATSPASLLLPPHYHNTMIRTTPHQHVSSGLSAAIVAVESNLHTLQTLEHFCAVRLRSAYARSSTMPLLSEEELVHHKSILEELYDAEMELVVSVQRLEFMLRVETDKHMNV
ncbi:transmembrane protein, putative [Bodo saltans]|uniref:Transmembrane protein, putative n=1 Tax=Bodo saltans TaxID=75058 RepID=A0A0S4IWQ3_BODSA|nr:transmembrane protein, putative [Bodo saltans]|eukprot:CUG31867.1 transmembrane protein, putative [Bodo saltans]